MECLYECLVQQKTLHALQGSAINKIPLCTLPPRPISGPSFPTFRGSECETTFYIGLLCVTTKKELLKSRSILGLGIKYSFLCMGILQISVFFSGV